MRHETLRLLLLLVLAAMLLCVNLGGYDLWSPDEPRYAQVAREMLWSGNYFLPRVNDEPYLEKPPLLFWLIAALSYPAGDVTEWTARIPSVLSGLAALLFSWLLARRLFNPRTALWTVVILLTMQRFWWNARFGQIDMLLTACLTAGLYGFLRWRQDQKILGLALFYGAAAAGLYAKGPGIIAFPVLFALAESWKRPDWKRCWMYLAIGAGTALALYAAWAVPAHVAAARVVQADAGGTLGANMFRQTIGRFFLGVSHANWPWYYLTTLPVDWLPWTLLAPFSLAWTWRKRREDAAVRFLLCWILPAFVFFSIAIGKRSIYLLPLFPAFAMLFAASAQDLMDGDHAVWRKRAAMAMAGVLLLLALAPGALLFSKYHDLWTTRLLLFSAATLVPAMALCYRARRSDIRELPVWIAGAFCAFAIAAATLIFPVVNIHKSAKDFCGPARELVRRGIDFDLYSVGFAREGYLFYSRRFFKEKYTELLPLEHAGDMSPLELARFQGDLLRIVSKAVDEVPIQDIKAISPAELAALREAILEAIKKTEYDPVLVDDFQRALDAQSANFFEVFNSDRPAYLYVQENDWRWVYAIHPEILGARVLREEQVGSRYVLLVANPSGAALMQDINVKN